MTRSATPAAIISRPRGCRERRMTRVAVTSRSFSRHPVLRAELLARHPHTTFNDAGASLSGDALVRFLAGHERAITALEIIDDRVLAALPELRVISKYGVGLDMLDLAAMARRGVQLGWTAGINRRSVAELVIGFAIALLRRVPTASAEMRAGAWRQLPGRELSGRTVGIVGCGHVGKELAKLLRAFGCRILAHDIRDYAEFYRRNEIEALALDDLMARADIVTLHVPLDATTRNMIDGRRLALMKPGALLINAARGGIVDEAALRMALEGGRLAGAAFDVFSVEPPDDPALLSLPHFLATPHIGGSTEEAILAMGRAAIDGLEDSKVPAPGDDCWPVAPAI